MNILIVDDHELNLAYFKFVLSKAEKVSHICTAKNEKEFLAGMYSRIPHLILLDINMPDLSGPDLIRKNRLIVGNTPIVLTSFDDDIIDIKQKMYDDGYHVVGHIAQPVAPSDLLGFIGS